MDINKNVDEEYNNMIDVPEADIEFISDRVNNKIRKINMMTALLQFYSERFYHWAIFKKSGIYTPEGFTIHNRLYKWETMTYVAIKRIIDDTKYIRDCLNDGSVNVSCDDLRSIEDAVLLARRCVDSVRYINDNWFKIKIWDDLTKII